MKTIWKFNIDPATAGPLIAQIPQGAQFLSAQSQFGCPRLWLMVEPEAPKELRKFWVFGTGHSIPSQLALRYLGTCQQHDGALIWHVFVEKTPTEALIAYRDAKPEEKDAQWRAFSQTMERYRREIIVPMCGDECSRE